VFKKLAEGRGLTRKPWTTGEQVAGNLWGVNGKKAKRGMLVSAQEKPETAKLNVFK